jgi:FG-GAP-like repeat
MSANVTSPTRKHAFETGSDTNASSSGELPAPSMWNDDTAASPIVIPAAPSLAAAAPAATTSPVSADSSTFGIHVSFDQDTSTLPAGFVNDVNAVVAFFQGIFGDTVNVNVHVGLGEYDNKPVDADDDGENDTTFDVYTYSQIRTALANDAKSALDSSAVASLPATDPVAGTHEYDVAEAEAQALGLLSTATATDVYIGVSSTTTFDYDRSNGIAAGDADFIGTISHELTEGLGRELAEGAEVFKAKYDDDNPIYYVSDLFHFSTQNARDLTALGGYISGDNGVTDIGNLNTGSDGDPGDLTTSTPPNSFDAFDTYGDYNDVTPNDLAWMDILGYDYNGDDYGSNTNFAGELSSTPIGADPFNYYVYGTINYITQGITPGDHDWFRVILSKGFSYRIDVNVGTLEESHLAIYDSSSNELASDINRYDGGVQDHSSRLFFTPTATGYYYIDVSGYLERETGTYTVSVVPDDYDASINTTGTLAVGGSSTGAIETDLDSDWFKIQLTAGHSYTFRMSGPAETSIELHDANGNNDGGYSNALGSSAFVYRAVTGGTYFLDASTNGSGVIGGYTVTANLRVADDYNGDGTSDILFRNGSGSGDTGFYQIKNGALQAWHDIGASSTAYAAVGVGDFNEDGVSDILFENKTNGDTGYYQMNYSSGTLQGWHDVWTASTAYSVAGIGDFNGDGVSDILYRNSATGDTGFYQMFDAADSAFENPGWDDIGATSTAYSVVGIGDFNADGTSDILFRNNTTGDTGFYTKTIANPWTWHDIGASATTYSVVGVGDFNGDGTSDILYRNNTSGDTGFYEIVNGVNTGWHDIGASSTAYSVVAVGDYNSDGTSDILYRNNTTGDTGFYAIVNGANTGWHDIVSTSSTAYHVTA